MLIWKNTSTLDGFDDSLLFTDSKEKAEIALLGSKPININEFKKLKAIFRAGVGKDNVPEKESIDKGVIVRYPSKSTAKIIYEETAKFTCSMILRMLYNNQGDVDLWLKYPRNQLSTKILLVIGTGRIGNRVIELMKDFLIVKTFDIKKNKFSELKPLIKEADCITIHIPKSVDNKSFIDNEKLSWMKDGSAIINTSRGPIIDETSLYNEIKSKRLVAACDVFWQEPYDGILKEFHPNNFYMTPHIASTSNDFLKSCRNDLDKLIADLKKNI